MPWLALIKLAAPAAFRVAEKIFGPKTGSTKMGLVYSQAKELLERAATAGKLSAAIPTEDEIRKALEAILADEKKAPDWREQSVVAVEGAQWVIEFVRKVE